MGKGSIFVIVGILIIAGLSWSGNGEGAKDTSRRSSSIGNEVETLSESATEEDVAKKIKEAERAITKLEKEAERVAEERNRSVYYSKVNISKPHSLNNPDPSREYITLTTRLAEGEKIDITGWIIKSDRSGNSATIGKATILPFPYTRGGENNVVLSRGDRAYLIKGFSPIFISFRTNVCTGYFEEHRTFYPSLSKKCPRPGDEIENEMTPYFSNLLDREDECLDIIERVPRCTTVGNEFLRDLPDTVTQSCKTYLRTEINYNVCVSNHKSDTDFPGNEYYVYLNRFGPLWRTDRETIKLYDRSGKVVDTVTWGF